MPTQKKVKDGKSGVGARPNQWQNLEYLQKPKTKEGRGGGAKKRPGCATNNNGPCNPKKRRKGVWKNGPFIDGKGTLDSITQVLRTTSRVGGARETQKGEGKRSGRFRENA